MTFFNLSIAMAAARNRELVKKEAEITAYEMRASGIPWNFNPVLGMGREPLWPRFWKTYGQDVYLATEMGRLYILGLQGNDMSAKDRAAACLKHYLGYSVPKNGKDRTPAWIPGGKLPFTYPRSVIGRDNQPITEPGEFKVMIKNLETKFFLK